MDGVGGGEQGDEHGEAVGGVHGDCVEHGVVRVLSVGVSGDVGSGGVEVVLCGVVGEFVSGAHGVL